MIERSIKISENNISMVAVFEIVRTRQANTSDNMR
jgi:hypothetical protein